MKDSIFTPFNLLSLRRRLLFILFIFLPLQGFAEEIALASSETGIKEIFRNTLQEGITVDLRNPEIKGGSLSTQEGGVIIAPGIRIQARSLVYTKTEEEGEEKILLVASGDLIFDYGEYHLIGDTLTYDFVAKTGTLTHGRGGYGMWYFGGTTIELYPDYSLRVENFFITTSEDLDSDWKLTAHEASLSPNKDLRSKNLRLVIDKIPTVWLPTFNTNLDWLTNSPFRYRLRWGGKQGLRLGVTYLALEWGRWQTFLRLDYRFQRGPGGGIETLWESEDKQQQFHSVNYIARDTTTEDPKKRARYRFEGGYRGFFDGGRTSMAFSYDKVSDEEMPDDYYDKGLAHRTVKKSCLHIRRQQGEWWVANLSTRFRLNDFQTMKQELPYLIWSHHPLEVLQSGIIAENTLSAGYLDFVFADDVSGQKDFSSARGEWHGKLYRPFHRWGFTATPFVESIAIFYGNTPHGDQQKWLTTSIFGGELKTTFNKKYACYKHIIEPYTFYEHVTSPSLSPQQHHIFDVDDGWHALKSLKFGLRQHLYRLGQETCQQTRTLTVDLFGYAFYDNHYNPTKLPRVYGDLLWNVTPYMQAVMNSSWDLAHHDLGHLNTLLRWTWNEDFAFTAEYRHRNAFTWRKADYFNFMMEASTSDEELEATTLSDKRDTFLLHAFYRFLPNWTAEWEYRRGWNRTRDLQKNYVEYQLDLTTTLRSHWHLRLSWQNREDDHRIVFYISLPNTMPSMKS